MELTTKQALIYCSCSLPTFTKKKIAHTMRGKSKYFKLKHLDKAFKNAPKILPPKEEVSVIIQVEEDLNALDVSKGETLFNELCDKFYPTIELGEYAHAKISSLTVIRLSLAATEKAIMEHGGTDIDLANLHSKLLRNEAEILKTIEKDV